MSSNDGLDRFVRPQDRRGTNRPVRRGRERRLRQEGRVAAEVPPTSSPDPVNLAVLAMEGLGRASVRACFTGTEVRVAAPDPETAAILQAAVDRTAAWRPTDRLIRVVVE